MMTIHKADPSEAGCWIDGHWGQYASARLIEIAAELGYVDPATSGPFAQRDIVEVARRELSFMGPHMVDDTRRKTMQNHPVCAGCLKPVRWSGEFWRAPEGWEHTDFIDPDAPCDRLSGNAEAEFVVYFESAVFA